MTMSSTPIDLPDAGPGKQTFEPQTVSAQAPEDGGALGSIQLGQTRWAASYTLGVIGRDLSDQWRAVMSRLRGQAKWFYGRDFQRPYPKAYPAGFDGMTTAVGEATFDGTCATWSQAIDGELNAVVTLTGLPAGFQLGVGDYIGFKWSTTRRALVRCVAASSAVGTGEVSVMVEPPVPVVSDSSGGVVPTDAVAYLNKPTCLMKRMANDAPLADLDRTGAVTTATINAIQDLQP